MTYEIRALLDDANGVIDSRPLDQLEGEEPYAYGLYRNVEGEEGMQDWMLDVADLPTANRLKVALEVLDELAAYVLPDEPCPERCACESEDGKHDPGNDDLLDALQLFVERARKAAV